jgi:hypothetical protein
MKDDLTTRRGFLSSAFAAIPFALVASSSLGPAIENLTEPSLQGSFSWLKKPIDKGILQSLAKLNDFDFIKAIEKNYGIKLFYIDDSAVVPCEPALLDLRRFGIAKLEDAAREFSSSTTYSRFISKEELWTSANPLLRTSDQPVIISSKLASRSVLMHEIFHFLIAKELEINKQKLKSEAIQARNISIAYPEDILKKLDFGKKYLNSLVSFVGEELEVHRVMIQNAQSLKISECALGLMKKGFSQHLEEFKKDIDQFYVYIHDSLVCGAGGETLAAQTEVKKILSGVNQGIQFEERFLRAYC